MPNLSFSFLLSLVCLHGLLSMIYYLKPIGFQYPNVYNKVPHPELKSLNPRRVYS